MKASLVFIGTVLTIAYFISRKKEGESAKLPQSMQAFDLLKQAGQ